MTPRKPEFIEWGKIRHSRNTRNFNPFCSIDCFHDPLDAVQPQSIVEILAPFRVFDPFTPCPAEMVSKIVHQIFARTIAVGR